MTWTPNSFRAVSLALADAWLLGAWELDDMHRRAGDVLLVGDVPEWVSLLADAVLDAYAVQPVDRGRELARYIEELLRADVEQARADAEEEEWRRENEEDGEDEWSDEDDAWDGEAEDWIGVERPADEPDWSLLGLTSSPFTATRHPEGVPPRPVRAPLVDTYVEPEPLPRLGLPNDAPAIRRWHVAHPRMGATRWPVPEIADTRALAQLLRLDVAHMQWFADTRSLERRAQDQALRNYRYAWVPRPGGVARLIEAPKERLRQAQRRVLRSVLDVIPPHEAAHGFRRGHSPVTNAGRHVGQAAVLRFDLEDFFASVAAGRVFGIFRAAGYPEAVAHLLTGLCTNAVPGDVLAGASGGDPFGTARSRLTRHLAAPHLPQGAPTSPAIANLVAYRLDVRLANFATSLGGAYSRYADDLTISGDMRLARRAASIRRTVAEIVREEGFRLNDAKTHLMTRAGRQTVTGIVVNEHPNVGRRDYDRLAAVLHDAAANGPEIANRQRHPDFRGHLLGRISWVGSVNPRRGERLRARFDRIDWTSTLDAGR